jgi:hypothetical protein
MNAGMRPDVRARFRAVVARGLARADREIAEELAKVRPYRRHSWIDERTNGVRGLEKKKELV